MKTRSLLITLLSSTCLLSSAAWAAPDTSGQIAIGGRARFGISPATAPVSNNAEAVNALSSVLSSSYGNSGLLSVRYGLNESFNLTGFLGMDIYNQSTEDRSGDSTRTSGSNSTTFAFGAQFDYIFAQLEKSRMTLGAGVFLHGIGSNSRQDSSSSTTLSTSAPMVFSVVPTLGYEYFLAPRLSLEGTIGLPVSFSSSTRNDVTTSNFSMNLAFEPFVGMNYYF